ncbi:hypothetical protein ACRYWZ_17555 (plasmid) [Agrobacterium deltaense]|uniref:hypothetical protein n=1 Tax=Agrobacterium deltaense TaxID=1183412 RepID=UPI003D960D28
MSRTATTLAVRAYKELLQGYLAARPQGFRQKIAIAIETDRSFVSQITNPKYATPIPPHHVSKIIVACELNAEERSNFLAAYCQAHPAPGFNSAGEMQDGASISIDLSMVRDELERAAIMHALRLVADSMIALTRCRKRGDEQ